MKNIIHCIALIESSGFHKYYDKEGTMTAEIHDLLTFH
jgi:hypothetical protein